MQPNLEDVDASELELFVPRLLLLLRYWNSAHIFNQIQELLPARILDVQVVFERI